MKKIFLLSALILSACTSPQKKEEIKSDDCAKEVALIKILNPTTAVLSDKAIINKIMIICGVDEISAKKALNSAKSSRSNHKI